MSIHILESAEQDGDGHLLSMLIMERKMIGQGPPQGMRVVSRFGLWLWVWSWVERIDKQGTRSTLVSQDQLDDLAWTRVKLRPKTSKQHLKYLRPWLNPEVTSTSFSQNFPCKLNSISYAHHHIDNLRCLQYWGWCKCREAIPWSMPVVSDWWTYQPSVLPGTDGKIRKQKQPVSQGHLVELYIKSNWSCVLSKKNSCSRKLDDFAPESVIPLT